MESIINEYIDFKGLFDALIKEHIDDMSQSTNPINQKIVKFVKNNIQNYKLIKKECYLGLNEVMFVFQPTFIDVVIIKYDFKNCEFTKFYQEST